MSRSVRSVRDEAPSGDPGFVRLVCPSDRASLREEGDGSLGCVACGARYPVSRGVASFLAEPDPFYEEHYSECQPTRFVPRSERLRHAWPLWLLRSGFYWAVRRHVPGGSRVLEVGCGSGSLYFADRYRMIGLDVASSSLVKVAEFYDTCVQAEVGRGIPLPDASVDAVVNSFLWEHIPPDRKPAVLAEWWRILRPGGRLVLLYDVASDNPLVRAMVKRDAALYHRLFIENEHHDGYQTEGYNRALFERAGFGILEHSGKEKTPLYSPWTYEKVRQFEGWPGRLARVGARFAHPRLLYPYVGLVRIVDELVGAALPMRWAVAVVTVCERPADAPGG